MLENLAFAGRQARRSGSGAPRHPLRRRPDRPGTRGAGGRHSGPTWRLLRPGEGHARHDPGLVRGRLRPVPLSCVCSWLGTTATTGSCPAASPVSTRPAPTPSCRCSRGSATKDTWVCRRPRPAARPPAPPPDPEAGLKVRGDAEPAGGQSVLAWSIPGAVRPASPVSEPARSAPARRGRGARPGRGGGLPADPDCRATGWTTEPRLPAELASRIRRPRPTTGNIREAWPPTLASLIRVLDQVKVNLPPEFWRILGAAAPGHPSECPRFKPISGNSLRNLEALCTETLPHDTGGVSSSLGEGSNGRDTSFSSCPNSCPGGQTVSRPARPASSGCRPCCISPTASLPIAASTTACSSRRRSSPGCSARRKIREACVSRRSGSPSTWRPCPGNWHPARSRPCAPCPSASSATQKLSIRRRSPGIRGRRGNSSPGSRRS